MKRMSKEGRITQVLEVLQANLDSIGKSLSSCKAAMLFAGIVKSWQYLKDNDNVSFFSLSFDWRFLFLIDSLMLGLDANDRRKLISEVFENDTVSLSTIFWILRHLEEQHNRFTEKHRHYDMTIVDEETLLKLEAVFLRRFTCALNSSAILDYPGFLNIIWLAEKIKPDIMKGRKHKLVSNDMSLAKLICASVSKGELVETVIRPFWRTNNGTIEEYINTHEAYKRLLKFIVTPQFSTLSEDDKRRVAAFLITMENQDNDSARKNEIMLEAIDERLAEIGLDKK